jgi:hypothetical protein
VEVEEADNRLEEVRMADYRLAKIESGADCRLGTTRALRADYRRRETAAPVEARLRR